MPIATMEELDAVPIGTNVLVHTGSTSRQEWTRTTEGWTSGTAFLESEMLRGFVAQGRIEDVRRLQPVVGEWWRGRHYWFQVMEVGDQHVRCLMFRRDFPALTEEATALTRFDGNRLVRMDAMPTEICTAEWMQFMVTQHIQMMVTSAEQEVRIQTFKQRPEPESLRPYISEMQRQLQALAAALD